MNQNPKTFDEKGISRQHEDAEIHRWLYVRTKRPPLPNSLRLPMYVPANERAD